jgi:hypothetical protein
VKSFRVLVAFVLVLGLLLTCAISQAAEPTEKEKIDAAVQRVEKSDLTFIRNDTEHTGKDAADHLRLKLRNAGDAIKTFDDFVDKIATKSSMSGKPYLVKMKDGTKVELAKWLRDGAETK